MNRNDDVSLVLGSVGSREALPRRAAAASQLNVLRATAAMKTGGSIRVVDPKGELPVRIPHTRGDD